jgi:DNA modification methylase
VYIAQIVGKTFKHGHRTFKRITAMSDMDKNQLLELARLIVDEKERVDHPTQKPLLLCEKLLREKL